MRIADVAARLDVSEGVVRRLISRGQLEHFRIGSGRGVIRVDEDQVARYLDSCKRGGNGGVPSLAPTTIDPTDEITRKHFRLGPKASRRSGPRAADA